MGDEEANEGGMVRTYTASTLPLELEEKLRDEEDGEEEINSSTTLYINGVPKNPSNANLMADALCNLEGVVHSEGGESAVVMLPRSQETSGLRLYCIKVTFTTSGHAERVRRLIDKCHFAFPQGSPSDKSCYFYGGCLQRGNLPGDLEQIIFVLKNAATGRGCFFMESGSTEGPFKGCFFMESGSTEGPFKIVKLKARKDDCRTPQNIARDLAKWRPGGPP